MPKASRDRSLGTLGKQYVTTPVVSRACLVHSIACLQNKIMLFAATALEGCLLWLLIVIFTKSTNSQRSEDQAGIVMFGTIIPAAVLALLIIPSFGKQTIPFIRLFQIFLLYFLLRKTCYLSRGAALHLCTWFIALVIVGGYIWEYLSKTT